MINMPKKNLIIRRSLNNKIQQLENQILNYQDLNVQIQELSARIDAIETDLSYRKIIELYRVLIDSSDLTEIDNMEQYYKDVFNDMVNSHLMDIGIDYSQLLNDDYMNPVDLGIVKAIKYIESTIIPKYS